MTAGDVAAAAGPPAIEARGLSKTYPGGVRALLATDLRVEAGEFLTLLGPSGCGKSTLLKLLAGLLPASAGTLSIWGQGGPGRRSAVDPQLAFVFQDATLMPWASVRRNVALPLELAAVPAAEAARRVDAALALVGLQRFADSLPRALSGGMQMRVSIARGLVVRPRLLLMDEPFGALDEISRNRLDGELLALWQRQGLTVVFVTHSIHEAVFLSQRVLVMGARPGRVVDEVRIDEPYPRRAEFRVGTAFAATAQRLLASLQAASGEPAEAEIA